MKCASAVVLSSTQRLARAHRTAKRDVAYLVVDRQREWAILAMSLPKLARFINDNLSSGQAWDRVSVTGLFESLNREDGRHGGWHKGRYRVRRMPLADSAPEFEAVRARCAHAAVVAARPTGFVTS